MLSRLRLALLCALVLCAGQAEAQALPNYDSCVGITWEVRGYNIYQQTTLNGDAARVGFLPSNDGRLTFPCPREQGTYYYTMAAVNALGLEGPRGGLVAFTILNPPPPPPLVLAIGGRAQIKALDRLNVRAQPGGAILGTQKNGATATVIGGPIGVLAPPQVAGYWWQLDFGAVKGWCLETFLVPVP